MTFTSITAQFWSYNRGITDFTKKPMPLDLLFQNLDQRVVSQELRLASGTRTRTWTGSSAPLRSSTSRTRRTATSTSRDPSRRRPRVGRRPAVAARTTTSRTRCKSSLPCSAMPRITWATGSTSSVCAPRTTSTNLKAQNQPSTGAGPLPPALVTLAPQDLTGNKLSPQASIQYKVRRRHELLRHRRARLPARGPAGAVHHGSPAITPVRAETTTSYELGVKSRLQHGVQLNAAVFFMDYKDRLYQSMVATGAGFQDISTTSGRRATPASKSSSWCRSRPNSS